MILYIEIDSSNISQWLQFLAVFVAVLTFIGNLFWQNHIRNRDTIERLNNEIFSACEKIVRTAYQANLNILTARYHYALYVLDTDKLHHERFYFKFYDEGQSAKMQVKFLQIDLVRNIQDYKIYGNKYNYDKISKLVSESTKDYCNDWAVFNEYFKTREKIEKEYNEQLKNINSYMDTEPSLRKNMRKIQKIVHPDYPLWHSKEL